VKRRLDNSSNSRRDDSSDAKKRSRLLDVAAFVLPFACVVLGVLFFGRSAEKNDVPYDVALETLEEATTDATCETTEQDALAEKQDASNEKDAAAESDVASNEEAATPPTSDERLEPVSLVSSSGEFEVQDENKLSVEEAERLLAQLEFQFDVVKKSDETDVDSFLASLATIRDAASELIENAPEETSTRARRTFDEIQALSQNLDANRAFFSRLKELDAASLDADATRAFFDSTSREFLANDAENSTELDEYRRDFARVANSLEALRGVERWNAFIEERGKSLERFYVSKQDADAALKFMDDCGSDDGTPREIAAIAKRERELEYAAQNDVATRRKVLLRIESELAKKYWTYRRDENFFYYLPTPPRVGVNEYIADAKGTLKSVDVPQNAPEISTNESPQKAFLRELYARASEIPDETRAADVALWYRKWCEILTEIQRTDRLDPILQYAFFRDVANVLASSDYYFSRRLEPLTRMLNVPQLDDLSKVDIFQAEGDEARRLRETARLRLSFLPQDHLTVDKTTEQLDANVAKFAWNYRRVGWLDRNFAGEWRCRRADDARDCVGELWVLRAPDAQDDASGANSKLRWVKIGVVDGRQATVNLIASETPRGAIVFCRARIDRGSSVAKRSSVERIFRR